MMCLDSKNAALYFRSLSLSLSLSVPIPPPRRRWKQRYRSAVPGVRQIPFILSVRVHQLFIFQLSSTLPLPPTSIILFLRTSGNFACILSGQSDSVPWSSRARVEPRDAWTAILRGYTRRQRRYRQHVKEALYDPPRTEYQSCEPHNS